MARAYLAPYGVGLGHASRLLSISEYLKDDYVTIRFSSYGEAVSYISNQGYECVEVPPIEFAWNNGGFSVKNSISNIPYCLQILQGKLLKKIETFLHSIQI